MLGLLVVDDEPFITESLAELFKNASELKLNVYTACSVNEAFNVMTKEKIDIILSDISMPNINGLEFQKMIGSMYPRIKIVFLTGYSDFDYAQAAIRGNCVDYILKTEDDVVIIGAVAKAADEVMKEMENLQTKEKLREHMLIYRSLLQKECLLGLLYSNKQLPKSINERFFDLDIPFDCEKQVLILLGQLDYPKGYVTEIINRSLLIFESIVTKQLETKMNVCSVGYESCRLVWLLQPKDKSAYSECIDFVSTSYDTIRVKCRNSFNGTVSLYMHESPCSFDELQPTFEMLGILAVMGELSNDLSKKDHKRIATNFKSVVRKINLLENYLNLGDKEGALKLLNEILDATGDVGSAFYTFSLEGYYYLAGFIISYINRNGFMYEILDKDTVINITKIEKHSSWEDVKVLFEKLVNRILDATKTKGEDVSIVDRVNQYIMNNLDKDTSLTAIADDLHYNAAYISRAYRNTTGETISDYIANLRINRAKEMLACPKYKITDIANAIGIDTLSYFDKFFKKATGVTPQEYSERIITANTQLRK